MATDAEDNEFRVSMIQSWKYWAKPAWRTGSHAAMTRLAPTHLGAIGVPTIE